MEERKIRVFRVKKRKEYCILFKNVLMLIVELRNESHGG